MQYGDSYTEDVTEETLKETFEKIGDKVHNIIITCAHVYVILITKHEDIRIYQIQFPYM